MPDGDAGRQPPGRVVAVGGPLDAGSVTGDVDGASVLGAGALVVPAVVLGAAVALVVDVAPTGEAGSPAVGDVVTGAVVLGTDVEP